jgi:hypothetical protein
MHIFQPLLAEDGAAEPKKRAFLSKISCRAWKTLTELKQSNVRLIKACMTRLIFKKAKKAGNGGNMGKRSTEMRSNGSLLILDASAERAQFQVFSAASLPAATPLQLFPGAAPQYATARLRCTLQAEPQTAVQTFLSSYRLLSPQEDLDLLIGTGHDPLHPFSPAFADMLQLLEYAARIELRKLILQTRSPLVLLAVPVLRALQDRLEIRIGIETLSDALAGQLTPLLPKPSERIAAAHTLTDLGIPVSFQVAPTVLRGSSSRTLENFASFLDRTPCPVRIIHPLQCLQSRLPAARRLTELISPHAHRAVYNALIRLESSRVQDQRPEAA